MTNMIDIKDKIVEAKKHKNDELSTKDKKSELPKLRPIKKIPSWCMSYPDFLDRVDEIWGNLGSDDKNFVATMIYFMTGDEDAENYNWFMIKEIIKNLYLK